MEAAQSCVKRACGVRQESGMDELASLSWYLLWYPPWGHPRNTDIQTTQQLIPDTTMGWWPTHRGRWGATLPDGAGNTQNVFNKSSYKCCLCVCVCMCTYNMIDISHGSTNWQSLTSEHPQAANHVLLPGEINTFLTNQSHNFIVFGCWKYQHCYRKCCESWFKNKGGVVWVSQRDGVMQF